MSNQNPQFLEWVKHAEDDLRMAELALKENGPPNQVCFHSQQTAEKYLKGFLVYSGQRVERVHHLGYLLELCVKIDASFQTFKEDVIYLNRFYIETRYPGDFPEVTSSEAKRAYEIACSIKQDVLKKAQE